MSTDLPSTASCPRCGLSLPKDAPEGLCPRCLAAVNVDSGSMFTGPGAPLPPPSIEELAPHFPQLEILACLGRGGMGVVYKARQKSLDRIVALKLLAPEREKDPQFAERFAREAQALAKLSHPHIVTVHDFGQAGRYFYLLMEYVDGANLRALLAAHRFTPEQALAIVPTLCDALQYAHDRGVVHRDIKPENLLMDREGRVKVADFGLAKILGATPDGDEQPVGTPSYMAPEQLADPARVDNRADIYSLGVVFYEMLTGELPAKNIEAPSRKVHIDVRLDEIVLRALEKSPDLRYQQVSALKTGVETITTAPARPNAQAAAAGMEPPPGLAAETTGGRAASARFSRNAIVGACWAPFFFLVAFAFIGVQVVPAGRPAGPTGWQVFLSFTLLPLGFAAPFGTSILGWVAISQIRRSSGRLYGLGLAVFDGLLFPLLLLTGFIIWLARITSKLCVDFFANPALQNRPDVDPDVVTRFANFIAEHPEVPIVAAVLVALIANVLIIRRVWRTVNLPIDHGSKTSTAGASQPAVPRRWWPVALALTAIVAVALAAWVSWLQRPKLLTNVTMSALSPDRKFQANAETWQAMRVFGPDRVSYRFRVQKVRGLPVTLWEFPVPTEKLATQRGSELPAEELYFSDGGAIRWSQDSKLVSFVKNGVELGVFNVETNTHHPTAEGKMERALLDAFARTSKQAASSEEVDSIVVHVLTPELAAEIAEQTELKRLNLQDASVRDAHLQQWAGLTELEDVNLAATLPKTPKKPEITDAGMAYVAQWKGLRSLNLHGNPVTDAGVKHLSALPNLQRLQLGGTRVTGEGLAELKALTWLRLDATPITDDGLRHVAQLTQLEQLYLDSTAVSDAGLEHLASLSKLRSLNVHGTKVTAGGIAKLKRRLPFLSVGATVGKGGADGGWQFGPVLEREMKGNDALADSFLDLDSGLVMSAPPHLLTELRAKGQLYDGAPMIRSIAEWATAQGQDLVVRATGHGLILVHGRTLPVAGAFDSIKAENVRAAIETVESMEFNLTTSDPDFHMAIITHGPDAQCVAFRTREGGVGLLEVMTFVDQPRYVRIRYKLLEN